VKSDSKLVSLDAISPADVTPTPLFGLDAESLSARMASLGEPGWRGKQLSEAIYRQWLTEIAEISTLPKNLRERLVADGWQIGRPNIAQVFQSVDGTDRYLIQTGAETVETVWMPEGDDGESGDGTEAGAEELRSPSPQQEHRAPSDSHSVRSKKMAVILSDPERSEGESKDLLLANSADQVGSSAPVRSSRELPPHGEWRRATICVSSQVGCAVNCQFCLTARLGLQRNLTAGEIAGQVVSVFARHGVEVGRDRVNLVFMGMGEPFLNYDNFMAAVRLLVKEVGLSPQRMTVSTSGIVPGIERFAQEPPDVRPKLAISLNAPDDQVRAEIMPINRKWNIEAVVDAVRQVQLRPRERITFEYVLLAGVTDQPAHARAVARLVRRTGLPAKVNLIAWNPGPGIPYAMPAPAAIEAFRATLAGEGIPTYLRKPRGRDIYAACGQLKRTVEG
jgi:23S rRNA (adenine2503-C2)-methyltransferase